MQKSCSRVSGVCCPSCAVGAAARIAHTALPWEACRLTLIVIYRLQCCKFEPSNQCNETGSAPHRAKRANMRGAAAPAGSARRAPSRLCGCGNAWPPAYCARPQADSCTHTNSSKYDDSSAELAPAVTPLSQLAEQLYTAIAPQSGAEGSSAGTPRCTIICGRARKQAGGGWASRNGWSQRCRLVGNAGTC